jgi:hypothetical protein
MKIPIIVKRKYLGIDLILTTDDIGLLDEVLLPDSSVNIKDLLDCNCRKFCVDEVDKVYMAKHKEAYE